MTELAIAASMLIMLVPPILVAWYTGTRGSRAERRAWADALRSLGSDWQDLGRFGSSLAYGRYRGFRVLVRRRERLEIVIEGEGRIPSEVMLGPRFSLLESEGSSAKFVHLPPAGTGDPDFDGAVALGGDPAVSAALFGPEERARIADEVRTGRLALRLGAIEWIAPGTPLDTRERLAAIERAVGFAQRACLDAVQVPARLHERATTDPDWRVRRRALSLLVERFPQRSEATAAARTTLLDGGGDPGTRLIAAEHLGAEGQTAASALFGDRATPEAIRVRAFAFLLKGLEPAAAARLTVVGLDDASASLRVASARAAGEARLEAARTGLVRSASASGQEEAVAAIAALGLLGGSGAEAVLIARLGDGRPQVRLAALAALAAVGGPLAVEPLRRVHRALLGSRDEAEAAQEAERRIHERLGPRTPGALALATGEGGNAGDVGALTLGEEGTAARLSIAATPRHGEPQS